MTANLSPARRWLLFALVLSAGVLNLADRQIIAVLKPTIAHDLHWSDDDYGTLAAWFQGSAAIAYLFTGALVDRLGVRRANPIGVAAWSLAAIAHGWARTLPQFIACRVALGATEAMGTPAAIKTIATIFPPALRSTGYGLSNAVGSLGAIIAPLAIPLVALAWGWRAAFVGGGLLGLGWAALWLAATRGVRFGDIAAREAAPSRSTLRLLADRRTWAVSIAKFLSDATWWLMLFWLPDFFHRRYGLEGVALGPPLAIAYTCSAVGSILGGGIATRLLAAGLPLDRVRKGMLLAAALLVLPMPLALHAGSYAETLAIIGLAIGAHQIFSTNLFALIADVTPARSVGRVTSIAAFFGNLGGMGIAKIAGVLLTAGFGYGPLFGYAALSYLVAYGAIRLLLPRIVRAEAE